MDYSKRTAPMVAAEATIKMGEKEHKAVFTADRYYQDEWWWILVFVGCQFANRSLHGDARFDSFEAALADANANGVTVTGEGS